MTCNEFAANLHLTAAAQRAHVGARFANRGPVRRYAPAALIDWHRVALAVAAAAPMLASIIIRFA